MRLENIFFLFTLLAGFKSYGQVKDKPNILFILSDDQSVPHLSCYGDPNIKTPNIDKVAENGIRFNQVYVSSPQCVPSRSSLMTGRNPVDTRMTRFSAPLQRDIVTMPELLRASGYYTGIQGRSYHLDGSEKKSKEAESVFKEMKLETFADRVDFLNKGADDKNLSTMQIFLNKVPKDKPFFLWLNYSNPHRPHTAPPEFLPSPDNLKLPPDYPDTKELRKDLSKYYGEVQQLDMYVGLILGELESRGLMKNTIVVFMGDNGAALLRGKGTLYQTGLRVPLVMCWGNKIKKGMINTDLLSGDDLAPTLLDFAGVKPDPKMSGKSFKPLLFNEKFERKKYVFAERGAHGDALPNSSAAFDLSRCVITDRFKLIYNALPKIPYSPVDMSGESFWKGLIRMNKEGTLETKYTNILFPPVRPMFELYDLKDDPYEMENLYGNPVYKEVQDELLKALNRWMIINQDFLPLPIDISKLPRKVIL